MKITEIYSPLLLCGKLHSPKIFRQITYLVISLVKCYFHEISTLRSTVNHIRN